MKSKKSRLETLRLILSGRRIGSQEELLEALALEGFKLTQPTLSRDLKQLNVAKAATSDGEYVYVLPSSDRYKRVSTQEQWEELKQLPGFISIQFSGNIGVIKTLPGHASSIAYKLDKNNLPQILGTIAGDDTIFIVVREDVTEKDVVNAIIRRIKNGTTN